MGTRSGGIPASCCVPFPAGVSKSEVDLEGSHKVPRKTKVRRWPCAAVALETVGDPVGDNVTPCWGAGQLSTAGVVLGVAGAARADTVKAVGEALTVQDKS